MIVFHPLITTKCAHSVLEVHKPCRESRRGQAFCRFYKIFALLSTIYNKSLSKTKSISTKKNVKSSI